MKTRGGISITVPVNPPQPAPCPAPHLILVVDDDAETGAETAKVLADSGYRVESATDGAAGWEALQAFNFDLMITGHQMPQVTGIELLSKLRAARLALPVIMTSRTLPEEDFRLCPWLQPEATLLRPHSGARLLEVVKDVLRGVEGARLELMPPVNGHSHPSVTAWHS